MTLVIVYLESERLQIEITWNIWKVAGYFTVVFKAPAISSYFAKTADKLREIGVIL